MIDRITRNERLFNLLGMLLFQLTPIQRTYAYEFVRDPEDYIYVRDTSKTQILLDPRRVTSFSVGRFTGREEKNSAFRKFPRRSADEDKYGIAFDLGDLEDVSALLSAYRSAL